MREVSSQVWSYADFPIMTERALLDEYMAADGLRLLPIGSMAFAGRRVQDADNESLCSSTHSAR